MIFSQSNLQKHMDELKDAEARLASFAKRYGNAEIKPFDIMIPRSSVGEKGEDLVIHGLHVKSVSSTGQGSKYPLVLLHGYCAGAAYYYRNLAGLGGGFYEDVYSLDWLGWGQSSRPSFRARTVSETEDFFVESLEAWRQKVGIEKVVLAGHSFGGYMTVAYCERYPQHVEKLILLSPVGINDENDPCFQERRKKLTSSLRGKMMVGVFHPLFRRTTVGNILRRYLTEERAYSIVQSYVERRLPQIEQKDEKTAIVDYFYHNIVAKGSGEYALRNILKSNILAKEPLQHRIPNLQVPEVSFFYGKHDWMDLSGGLLTQRMCEEKRLLGSTSRAPLIHVGVIPDAGHLLMPENWQAVNAGVVQAGGGPISCRQSESIIHHELPKLLRQQA